MTNVNVALASLEVTLNAGDANVLEKVTRAINSDAVIDVTSMPTIVTSESSEALDLLSLLQKIEFRNRNSISSTDPQDDIRFRISASDYSNFENYMTDVFTPLWENSDADTEDGRNDAQIRAKTVTGGTMGVNQLDMTVTAVAAAPGNFNGSKHGSFPDLHLGYVAAALTNAHEGRAVILNEPNVFNSMNGSFGSQFMSSLFEGVSVDSDNNYYTLDMEGNSAGPLKDLLSALYHQDQSRFQQPTPETSDGNTVLPDTEEFQALPIVAGDTISFKVTVDGSISMNAASLADDETAKSVLKNITSVCDNSPNDATFEDPVNHDKGGIAGSDNDITVEGTTVSVSLRSQIYEVSMTA